MKKKLFKDLLKSIFQMKKMRKRKTNKKFISHKKLVKVWKAEEKWNKKHPILAKFKTLWWWIRYGIKNKLEDIPRDIKYFIQRGKKGWSNRDVWGLDYYLSDVIYKTVRHLKKHNNGHPDNLTEGQWIDILNIIADTFEFENRCSEGNLYLIRDKKKRNNFQKVLDKSNDDYNFRHRCMTDNEIKLYDKGWKLFKKYFFNLWD